MEKDNVLVNLDTGEVFFTDSKKLNKLTSKKLVKWTDEYGGAFVFKSEDLSKIRTTIIDNNKEDGKYQILLFNDNPDNVYDIITKYNFEIRNGGVKGFNKLNSNNILKTKLYELTMYGEYHIIILPEKYNMNDAKDSLEKLHKIVSEFTFKDNKFDYAKVIYLLLFKYYIDFFKSLLDNSNYVNNYIREGTFVVSSMNMIFSIFNTIINGNKGQVKWKSDKTQNEIIDILEKEVESYGHSKSGFVKYFYKNYQLVLNETSKHLSFFNTKGKFFYSIDLNDGQEDYMTPMVHKIKTNKNQIAKNAIRGGIVINDKIYNLFDKKGVKQSTNGFSFDTFFGMNVKVSVRGNIFNKKYSTTFDKPKKETWNISTDVYEKLKYHFYPSQWGW